MRPRPVSEVRSVGFEIRKSDVTFFLSAAFSKASFKAWKCNEKVSYSENVFKCIIFFLPCTIIFPYASRGEMSEGTDRPNGQTEEEEKRFNSIDE